jgi:hypothetical protein
MYTENLALTGVQTPDRPTRSQKAHNIEMNLEFFYGVDWINLPQDRDKEWAVVNTVMNLRFPYNARNFLSS